MRRRAVARDEAAHAVTRAPPARFELRSNGTCRLGTRRPRRAGSYFFNVLTMIGAVPVAPPGETATTANS